MEELRILEVLFKEPIFQFFLIMALLHLLAQVFFDRRIAFWISALFTTLFWLKNYEPITALKAWFLILVVFLLYIIPKLLFHFNLFLFLKGKKRCPMCYCEVHWKALVCPFCKHRFKKQEVLPGEE